MTYPSIPQEIVIGAVVGKTVVVDHTPTCLTSALDANDVLADTEANTTAIFRANDKPGIIQSLTVIDKDDFGDALRIWLFDADVVLGVEGANITMADGDADNCQGIIEVAAGDYVDAVNSKIAFKGTLSIPVVPLAATDDLYIAVQAGSGNTNQYTASGLVLRFGILQD